MMMNLPSVYPPSRAIPGPPPPATNGASSPAVKTRMCNKYNMAEGCKFGNKCHFAHGHWELGKPVATSFNEPRAMGPIPACFGSRMQMPQLPPLLPSVPGPASSFGTSAMAKISVDAFLAGAIIGKDGVNSKQICCQTGAKLSIRDHESGPALRNIKLEGTFEQINEASALVGELIVNVGTASGYKKGRGPQGGPASPGSNFRAELCDNFAKGSCTFRDRCSFAHGSAELRRPGLLSECLLSLDSQLFTRQPGTSWESFTCIE